MYKGLRKSVKAVVFATVLLCGSLCLSTGVKAYDEKAAEIKGGRTNIRADGNKNAAVITAQNGGFKLTIVNEKKDSEGNVWYRVNFDLNGATKTGYIMSDFVTITGDASPAPSGAATAGSSAAPAENVSVTDLKAEVDGVVYNIATEVPKSKVPEGFTEFNAKYQGKDITVVKNKQTNVVLAYLKAEGKEGLFVYDQSASTFKAYDPSGSSGGSNTAASTAVSPSSAASKTTTAGSTEIEELKFQRFLMMVAITAEAVIILVLIIALALKGRKGRDDYDDFDAFDDDEDDEDEDDDYDYDRKHRDKAAVKTKARSEIEIDKAVQNIVAREEAERAKVVDDYKKADIRPDDDYRPAKVPPRGTDAGKKTSTEFEMIDFDD